jgi:hypothetical protein
MRWSWGSLDGLVLLVLVLLVLLALAWGVYPAVCMVAWVVAAPFSGSASLSSFMVNGMP